MVCETYGVLLYISEIHDTNGDPDQNPNLSISSFGLSRKCHKANKVITSYLRHADD